MRKHVIALLEDPARAEQMEICLEACGHSVTVITSFSKAKKVLVEQHCDLIISDVHLENGGNVFDFLRWVKDDFSLCGERASLDFGQGIKPSIGDRSYDRLGETMRLGWEQLYHWRFQFHSS